MPPNITPIASKIISYFIIFILAYFYITRMVVESIEDILTIGLSIFGTIAILSALCFSLVSCLEKEADKIIPMFAGERFLHSSILLIQILFLKFACDLFLSLNWVKSKIWLTSIVLVILTTLTSGLAAYAFLFAAKGFDLLNRFFWERFEKQKGASANPMYNKQQIISDQLKDGQNHLN